MFTKAIIATNHCLKDFLMNKGKILMGMVFLEMAYLKVYTHNRFISLPCLLFGQFKKTFTPQIPKF